jgi:hypothetical protein
MMLHDRRNYAAALLWPLPPKLGIVTTLKRARCDIETSDRVYQDKDLVIDHCFLYDKTAFTRAVETLSTLKKDSKADGRPGQYRYSFYVATYAAGELRASLLAAPYNQLGLYLAQRASPRSSASTYGLVQLAQFILYLGREATHAGCRFVLSGADYIVKGDENGSRFTIRGENVLEAKLYEECAEKLRLLKAKPRKIQVSCATKSFSRLRVWFDRYGNWRFRVSAGGGNLAHIGPMIGYLSKRGLISTTSHIPFESVDDEENDRL